jgi:hypothetical protein
MSAIEQSKPSNLEGEGEGEKKENRDDENEVTNDFGNSELNDTYRKLDKKSKDEFDKISKKEIQISLLKTIAEPSIQKIYEGLNENEKLKVDKLKIRDKYLILKQLAKQRESVKSNEPTKTQNVEVVSNTKQQL